MIGFYGGTFDPIHIGHIHLAIRLLEAHQLSEVWFCPAKINPLRQSESPTPISHRLKMVELAISSIPKFKVIDLEAKREGPSYTFDTLCQLQKMQQEKKDPRQIALLLGEDSIAQFDKWHRAEEIAEHFPLLIGRRLENFSLPHTSPKISAAIKKGWTPIPVLDISSTEIRKRLKNGLYCGDLVPAIVMDYIYLNRLYS